MNRQVTVNMPEVLLAEARRAVQEHESLDEFVCAAVKEKLAIDSTIEYYRQRGSWRAGRPRRRRRVR
jgi:hypothetical protein